MLLWGSPFLYYFGPAPAEGTIHQKNLMNIHPTKCSKASKREKRISAVAELCPTGSTTHGEVRAHVSGPLPWWFQPIPHVVLNLD